MYFEEIEGGTPPRTARAPTSAGASALPGARPGAAARPAMSAGEGEGRTGKAERVSAVASGVDLFWRFWQLGAAATAIAVMCAADQNGVAFQNFQAFIWLVTAMSVVVAWALFNLARDIGRFLPFSVRKAMALLAEFVVAWIALSGASAAAGLTTFADSGAGIVQPGHCQMNGFFNSLCARTKAATAMAFFAFFLFIPSLISKTTSILLLIREGVQ